jgi:hypothetical protein
LKTFENTVKKKKKKKKMITTNTHKTKEWMLLWFLKRRILEL